MTDPKWRRFKVNNAEIVNNSKTSKSWANTAVFIVLNNWTCSNVPIYLKPQTVGKFSNNENALTFRRKLINKWICDSVLVGFRYTLFGQTVRLLLLNYKSLLTTLFHSLRNMKHIDPKAIVKMFKVRKIRKTNDLVWVKVLT